MDKKTVLGIISKFKDALEAKGTRVKKLVLFGSFSTRKYREGSDIDIVVISDDFKGKNYWERIDILSSAIYDVFAPIEAIAMTSAEWERRESLIVDYAKDGQVIYG